MRAWVPADLDRADRIAFGLSLRQLALLAPYALAGTGALLLTAERLPLWLTLVVGGALAGVGWGAVTQSLDGEPLDALALAALRHLGSAGRRVAAPEGVAALPSWHRAAEERVRALELPWGRADRRGHLDLHEAGMVAVLRASALDLTLRTEEEAAALVEGYARFLNALSEPLMVWVHAEPADLGPLADELERGADGLPHPRLRDAARSRARHLRSLGAGGQLVRRRAYLCLRGADPDRIDQRAAEAAELLRGVGLELTPLGPAEVEALLEAASAGGAA